MLKGSPSLLEKCLTDVSHTNLPLVPEQEFDTQFLLQTLYLLADGRLRYIQSLGSPAEVQFLRHGYEASQMSQLHTLIISYSDHRVLKGMLDFLHLCI